MTPYTKIAKQKGWKMKDLASRWDMTPRHLSRISADPSQRDWDALSGVPAKSSALVREMIHNKVKGK